MTAPKFLVDECCPAAVADELRRLSFDVHAVVERAQGLSDHEVLRLAWEEGRILVTTDKDFGALAVRSDHRLDGLLLLRYPKLGSKSVAAAVADAVLRRADTLDGHLTVPSEKRMRRRTLHRLRT